MYLQKICMLRSFCHVSGASVGRYQIFDLKIWFTAKVFPGVVYNVEPNF